MINGMGGIGNVTFSNILFLCPPEQMARLSTKEQQFLMIIMAWPFPFWEVITTQLSMVTLNVAAASTGVWLKIYSSDLHTHHGNPVSDHPASCGKTPWPVAPAVTTEPCSLAHTGQWWFGRLTCGERHRRKELLLSTASWQAGFIWLVKCVCVFMQTVGSSIRFTCNTRHTADSFHPMGVFSTWKPNHTATNVWIVAVCTGAQQGAHFTAPNKLFWCLYHHVAFVESLTLSLLLTVPDRNSLNNVAKSTPKPLESSRETCSQSGRNVWPRKQKASAILFSECAVGLRTLILI